LILLELVVGRSAFAENLALFQIASMLVFEDARPEIPDSVLLATRALIEACWATDPDERPTFEEIVNSLTRMQFKVTAHVNSAKVAAFVTSIEAWEACHPDA
jgi:hypothetical protein